jgi:protein SCO1/2
MKKYSYAGIAFIVLIFGIYAIPKIVAKLKTPEMPVIGKAPSFSFTNQDGETINNSYYDNKVYVAEFFFTTCPTICPIMNDNMVKIQNEFYGNLDFGIVSFSINPEYDTPEILKAYAKDHNATLKTWHFLTGDKAEIYKVANQGFALYAGENAAAQGGFEHSGMFALIDKEGNIRSRLDEQGNPIGFYDGTDSVAVQRLKDDIKVLLKE